MPRREAPPAASDYEGGSVLQSCQVVFELFSILIPQNQYFAEEIRIFRAAIT